MRRLFLCATLCLVFFSTLTAQNTWAEGTLKTKAGTTLKGEILQPAWQEHIAVIQFRNSSGEGEREFAIQELLSFSVGEQAFIIASDEIIVSPRSTNGLVNGASNLQRATITGALRALPSGEVQLYEFFDQQGLVHFFVQPPGEKLSYLEYGRYRKEAANGQSYVQEINGHHFYLNELTKDCPDLRNKVTQTRYAQNAMLNLLSDYYECQGKAPLEITKLYQSTLNFGLLGGYAYLIPRYSINDEYPDYFNFDELSGSGFSVGAFARYQFPSAVRTSLTLSATYSQATIREVISRVDLGGEIVRSFEHNQSLLSLALQAEFTVLKGKSPLILGAGLAGNYAFTFRDQRLYSSITTNGQIDIPLNFVNDNTLFVGPVGGISWDLGNLEIGLRASYFSQLWRETHQVANVRLEVLGFYEF